MNEIYIKTTDNQIKYHSNPSRDKFVSGLAASYNDTSSDILWKVYSEGLTTTTLIDKYSQFGTVLNKIDAYLLGKQLQPDRYIPDPAGQTGEGFDYSFDYVLPLTLDESKQIKIKEVDIKTQYLISLGYNWQTGVTFSLSPSSQLNWSAIRTQRISGIYSGVGSAPITTIDDDEYLLDYSDIETLTDNIFATVKGYLDSGRTLKIDINNQTTIQDVSDIDDDR
jgi:hypothetical protein